MMVFCWKDRDYAQEDEHLLGRGAQLKLIILSLNLILFPLINVQWYIPTIYLCSAEEARGGGRHPYKHLVIYG